MPNMKNGVSPTTIPILYVSESMFIYLFMQTLRFFFIKPFLKPKANANYPNLNNASEASARSLWIRTHSRHLECELLLDDRLMHLPDRSHVSM